MRARRRGQAGIGLVLIVLGIVAAIVLSRGGRRSVIPPPSTAPPTHAAPIPAVPVGWHVLARPIDPAQQTDLPFGFRSHWLAPWRAYLFTQPASMMRAAVGINFNVPPQYAERAAHLLAVNGFKRARVEIGWSAMSYSDPTRLADPAAVDTILGALKAAGIRPLILLNANDGDPGPSLTFDGHVTAPAPAGSRTVQVGPGTARALVPGLSGFEMPGGRAAQFIVTAVSPTGRVELSQPLPVAVPPGFYPARLLRYAPFAPPLTRSGEPNPAFQRTLSGWLRYVQAVTGETRRVLGNDDFDVEVWNELTLGSDFLNVANYYNPVPASLQGTGSVEDELLARTVQWLRDPAHDLRDVGIGDGFANETPFVSAARLPAGVTAIDKHPYHEAPYEYPADQVFNNQRPVDALGHPAGTQDAAGNWHDDFIPSYEAYFPEYLLSGIQTEFLERDLSPITSTINGLPHGLRVRPAGAAAPPRLWITETNIDLTHADGLTPAARRHVQAKATLRTLAAYVNKGVSAIYFYAVADGSWSMVDPRAPDGGATMTAVRSFLGSFAGPDTIAPRRSLRLLQIADRGNWIQFRGNGTAAYPPLYNRDVVAFLPFQVDAHKFVIPAYVMTRNLAKVYRPAEPPSDVSRYDLPPETYRLVVGGLVTRGLRVSASDPLTGASVPVHVTATSADTAVLELGLTDYPRLITIQDR